MASGKVKALTAVYEQRCNLSDAALRRPVENCTQAMKRGHIQMIPNHDPADLPGLQQEMRTKKSKPGVAPFSRTMPVDGIEQDEKFDDASQICEVIEKKNKFKTDALKEIKKLQWDAKIEAIHRRKIVCSISLDQHDEFDVEADYPYIDSMLNLYDDDTEVYKAICAETNVHQAHDPSQSESYQLEAIESNIEAIKLKEREKILKYEELDKKHMKLLLKVANRKEHEIKAIAHITSGLTKQSSKILQNEQLSYQKIVNL